MASILPRHRTLSCALALSMAACVPQPNPTAPPATPSPAPPSVALTPTPTLDAALTGPAPRVLPTQGAEDIGLLENRSSAAVETIIVEVSYLDSQGELLHRTNSNISLPWLAPGAVSPFLASYQGPGAPAEITAELLSYQLRTEPTAAIEARIVDQRLAPSGETLVLGTLRPLGRQPALLHGLVMTLESDGLPLTLSSSTGAPRWLPRGEPVPFEATFQGALSGGSLATYSAGRPAADEPAPVLEVDLSPGLAVDDQGNPFVVGTMLNPTRFPARPHVLVEVSSSGSPLRLLAIQSQIPVAPGEIRSFGLRLQNLPPGAEPSTLALRAFADDERTVGLRTSALSVRVSRAEPIGGSLFLRGQVGNLNGSSVQAPTLFGALRSTEGQLLSASWLPLGDRLGEEMSRDFVLSLPLPADTELPEVEFDLRALGLAPGANR